MTADDMVVTDLDGKKVFGELKPSSGSRRPICCSISHSPNIGGVVHSHSEFATIWAQAARAIPALGTTHADYFHGPVPVTRQLTRCRDRGRLCRATPVSVIVEALGNKDPMVDAGGCWSPGHGPFCWGRDAGDCRAQCRSCWNPWRAWRCTR